MITAFVMVNAAKDTIPELAETLAGLEHVYEVYSVTGEFDLIAIVRVAEFDRVAEVIAGDIAKLPNVVKIHTHVAFRAYSQLDLNWI